MCTFLSQTCNMTHHNFLSKAESLEELQFVWYALTRQEEMSITPQEALALFHAIF